MNHQYQRRFNQCALVLESWESAKQRHSCPEDVGILILLELFQFDPSTLEVFGFHEKQTVTEMSNSPLLQMGMLIHGGVIVRMLNGVLGMLGPDAESANEILQRCGKRHVNFGVKPSHFGSMIVAVRNALKRILGDAYTSEMDEAWNGVLCEASKTIIKSMT